MANLLLAWKLKTSSPGWPPPSSTARSRQGPAGPCPVPRPAAVGAVMIIFQSQCTGSPLGILNIIHCKCITNPLLQIAGTNYRTRVSGSSQELPTAVLKVTKSQYSRGEERGRRDRWGCGAHPFSHLFSTIFKTEFCKAATWNCKVTEDKKGQILYLYQGKHPMVAPPQVCFHGHN